MKLITLGLLMPLLAACSSPQRISVPVTVKIPVAVKCGVSGVPATSGRPELPIDRAGSAPIDKIADYLTASAIRLGIYARQLELERDGLRRYEAACSK